MVEELQDLYIDELQELDSELEDMDTEFKATAQMVSYSLEKASDNVYIDGMDELITQIEETTGTPSKTVISFLWIKKRYI